MSFEDYDSVAYILNVVTAPVMVVGIFTNLLTIIVYLRMSQTVTSTFFTLATVLDVAFLVMGLPPILAQLVMGEESFNSVFFFYYVMYGSNYATTSLRKVIVCVTMLMSLDRYLMVSFPFRMRKFTHLRRPKLYTLIVSLAVFLIDINVLFKYTIIELSPSMNSTGSPTVIMQSTRVFQERRQMFENISLTASFIFQYIPLILIVVCNLLLVFTLVRYSRDVKSKLHEGAPEERKEDHKSRVTAEVSNSRGSGECQRADDAGRVLGQGRGDAISGSGQKSAGNSERQNSMMVLVYSFFFALLALPNTAYPLVRQIIPELTPFDRLHFLAMTLGPVFFLLDIISSAMNFFIYFITGSSFRASVFQLFVAKRRLN